MDGWIGSKHVSLRKFKKIKNLTSLIPVIWVAGVSNRLFSYYSGN